MVQSVQMRLVGRQGRFMDHKVVHMCNCRPMK